MNATDSTIIVGVDGSDRSADALDLASILGEALDAAPRSVHVEARSPAGGLLRAAEQHAADAIVVGTSHRSRVGRVFPGGTAERLLASAPCPIAIAPRRYAEREHGSTLVGCAFDGSRESRAALTWTKRLAGDGVTIRLLTAEEPRIGASAIVGTGVTMHSLNDERHRELSREVANAERELRAFGFRVEVMLIEARAVPLLEQQSGELDVLVVGCHGFGPVRAVLFGSVSNTLVRTAASPLVVVPAVTTNPRSTRARGPARRRGSESLTTPSRKDLPGADAEGRSHEQRELRNTRGRRCWNRRLRRIARSS
jgi:nucleotide-binding universal stress UspA family protein